ncbi:MAG: cupin domain-containing protein, partial [Bacteroidetes bacterium]
MKLRRKITENYFNQRINIFQRRTPCFDTSWHYHPEYELIYIDKGEGIRYVGDSVAPFSPGELVLVGAYLPHLWKNDDRHVDSKYEVKNTILQFTGDVLSRETFKQSEFAKICQLLEASKLGISFGESVAPQIHERLLKMMDASSTVKLLELLNILHELSLAEDQQALSSIDTRQFTNDKSDRLESVISYISNHYTE